MPMLYQILIDALEGIAIDSKQGAEKARKALDRYYAEKLASDEAHFKMLSEDAAADLRRDLGIIFKPR